MAQAKDDKKAGSKQVAETKADEKPEQTSGSEAASESDKGAKKDQGPRVKIKPELDEDTRQALELRQQINRRRPAFRRPEWFRYKKLSRSGWRRPYGLHNKQRRHFGYRPNVVSIGYAGPAAVRGLHPSGFQEVLVHNVRDLQELDPKSQAARIAGGVGARKREEIEDEAQRLKIRVLNPMHPRGDEE